MTRYAYVNVENREIIEICDALPTSWKNYSNFNLMDAEGLKQLGWLPIVEPGEPPEIDRFLDRITTRYDIGEDAVYCLYVIEPLDPESVADKRQVYMDRLRLQRNYLLQLSDWTVLPDMIEMKGETWKSQWVTYRQQLRDFTSTFDALDLSEFPTFENISWPTPPSA